MGAQTRQPIAPRTPQQISGPPVEAWDLQIEDGNGHPTLVSVVDVVGADGVPFTTSEKHYRTVLALADPPVRPYTGELEQDLSTTVKTKAS